MLDSQAKQLEVLVKSNEDHRLPQRVPGLTEKRAGDGDGAVAQHSASPERKNGFRQDDDTYESRGGFDGGPDKSQHGYITQARGFDVKSSPKPEKYNLKPETFEVWRELFIVHLVAMD